MKSLQIFLFAYVGAVLATLSDSKVFESWEQVSILWDGAVNPLLLIGHPHLPRYLVAYPGFLLQEILPIYGFSIYISIFFAFNVLLLTKLALLVNQRQPSILVILSFIAAHLAMNGRGVIAWTSWLICLWVCLKVNKKIARPLTQFGWIVLSCWLAAVSTGVFILVMAAFIFSLFRIMSSGEKTKSARKLFAFLLIIPIGYALLEYLLIAIQKNVEFYGGGIDGVFNMLQHGLGVIFINLTPINLLMLFILGFFVIFVMAFVILGRSLTDLERFIALPLLGGFFGFTVLTLAIPPMLLHLRAPRLRLISTDIK
jgi:hypothetical protein